ncbi:O-antigen/teichoic acid export membrane protein [Arcticibacter tournemirensis]|uniref:Oligosaccharide flippase family protein n=1 Tax=Arcticibacter tournemirensis TaxID=699437 RepID=A0A5M9HE97_9SPHI|nr:oligosaccharide flippase family protein [Arcticibacter tournemirensis]KAA8484655.1 oligosaccharide flippase family protein [Arcticibacter tournemirensis]TQM47054.1 O-antigen/teichoic acid export membrane protein [Arcticibacter tournemirensis]
MFFFKFFLKSANSSYRTYSIKREIVLSFFIKIVSVIVGILLVPLLIDYVDKERYGVWLTLSSIFAWFSFFDIGIGNGMRNKLTRALSESNRELAREYVSTTYAIISVIFCVIILLFQVINPYINWQYILNANIINQDELYSLTSVVLSLFLLRFIFQLTGVIYIADQRPSVNNALTTFGSVLSFIIVALLYKFTIKSDLLTLGIILVGAPLVVLIAATIYAFSGKYKFLKPNWQFISLRRARSLLNLGLKFFILQVAAILLFSSGNIIISHLFEPSEVVIYNTALTYYQLPIITYGIVIAPIWSAVTDAYIKQDFVWLRSTLKRLNQLSILFSIAIVIMILLGPYVFRLWVGDRIELPLPLSLSMACFAMISVCLSPYTSFINGIGKIKLSIYIVFLTLVFFIPIAYFFAKWLNNSAGIILATCALNAVSLYFQPMQVKKIINERAEGIWNE